MVKENYLINEAAKEVHVESHVLRYWEDELGLSIKRNPQGHRIYTYDDIEKLIKIKNLKDQGLQLKAVKSILSQDDEKEEHHSEMRMDNPFAQKQLTKISKNGDMKLIPINVIDENKWKEKRMIEVKEKKLIPIEKKEEVAIKMKDETEISTLQKEKILRMQYLLQKMIKDTLELNNNYLINEITDNIKSDICKEMDYQFRLLNEHEDEREKKRYNYEDEMEKKRIESQEEHYRRIDELLREKCLSSSNKKENNKEQHLLRFANKK